MTWLKSMALWFTFMAILITPAVQAKDHEIEVYTKNNTFYYQHKKGLGIKGYAVVKNKHSVQWSCRQGDELCKKLLITFGANGNPCRSSALGPAPTVTCDDINPSTYLDFPYTTQVCDDQGKPLNLVEDPEFIVDSSSVNYQITAVLGLLGLILAGFIGYRWGKTQGRRTAP